MVSSFTATKSFLPQILQWKWNEIREICFYEQTRVVYIVYRVIEKEIKYGRSLQFRNRDKNTQKQHDGVVRG